MNYIKEINAFYNVFLPQNQLSANAQALWHRLMAYCNAFCWKRDFTVSNTMLIEQINFHISEKAKDKDSARKQALERARNDLIQRSLIYYKKGTGNQCGSYTMVSLISQENIGDNTQYDTHNDTHSDTHDNTQYDTQYDTHSVTAAIPLDKLNKTKLNETKLKERENAHTREDTQKADEIIFTEIDDYSAELNECGNYYMQVNGKPIPSEYQREILMRLQSGVEVMLITECIKLSANKHVSYFRKIMQNWYADGVKTYRQYCEKNKTDTPIRGNPNENIFAEMLQEEYGHGT